MFDNDILDHRVTKRRRYLNDLILLAACLLIAGLIFIIVRISGEDGSTVSVLYDSDIIYSHPMDREGFLVIEYDNGPEVRYSSDFDEKSYGGADADSDINVIRIADGCADMIYANCPDLICVHTRPVSRTGASIICLPHKITVTVSDDRNDPAGPDNETDAVTW